MQVEVQVPVDQNSANAEEEGIQRLPLAVGLEPRTASSIPIERDSAILNGYVESHADERFVVVERPGRTLVSNLSLATTISLAGMYYYHERRTTIKKGTLAVAYSTNLVINPSGGAAGTSDFSFFGLFPGGSDASTDTVGRVFFEGIPLPDLIRTATFPEGKTLISPPLEGFFMNSVFDGYFYNTRVNTLSKITSLNYPYRVIGGTAWLNGRFYVMTEEGRIFCSDVNDAYTWQALNFINAIMSPDRGIGVFRTGVYILAMGRNSIEVFYDSGAALGNPLRRVESAAHDFGCKSAASVVRINDMLIFAGHGETAQETGVYMMEGQVPKKISTPFVDRLLALNTTDIMWAYPIFHNGLHFYAINVAGFNATLVFGIEANLWYMWTSNLVERG